MIRTESGRLGIGTTRPGLLAFGVVATLLIALGLALVPLDYAAMAVVGAAAFLLTIVRPTYGLYLLMLAVPFGSLQTLPLGSLDLTGVEVVTFLTALGWVMRAAATREARLPLTAILVATLALVLVLAASAWSAAGRSAELPGGVGGSVKEVVKWAEFLLVYLLAASILRTGRPIVVGLGVLLVAGTLAALMGWYQFWLRIGPESFIVAGRFLRAYGPFGQPNPFAGYLGMTLTLIFGVLVGWRTGGGRPSRWLWWVGGAGLVMAAAVAMSLSRGAWIGLVASLALMLALNRRRGMVLFWGGLLLVVAVEMAGAFNLLPVPMAEGTGDIFGSFRVFDAREVEPTAENWAIVERMANWQAAWNMFVDYPWLGVGVGNFTRLYPDYALPYWKVYPAIHAHNYYLNVLAENGLLGLGTYQARRGTWLASAFRVWGSGGQTGSQRGTVGLPLGVGLGVLGVMVYLSTHSLFDDLYVHGMTAQVAVFLGMLSGVGNRSGEGDPVNA